MRLSDLVIALGVIGVALFFKNEAQGALGASMGDPDFFKYDQLFKVAGARYGVPWRWLKATAMTESSLGKNSRVAKGIANPSDIEGSKSYDGVSWGLMQTTLTTAREYSGIQITAAWLNVPANSIDVAGKYFRAMIKRFGIEDRESVVRAYNGGPGFKSTVQGRTLTPVYYAKWSANLNTIMGAQPGSELE